MKLLAAWFTFSCLIVPVWATVRGHLIDAKRWTIYAGDRQTAHSLSRPARLAIVCSQPRREHGMC